MPLDPVLARELHDLESIGRLRTVEPFDGADRLHPFDQQGRPTICFSSNDYLGLSDHPAVVEAATVALRRHGVGSAASRLVSGDTLPHHALEDALATYLRTEGCLLFPTGYQANLGALTALAGADDFIASDAANHASLIDGCRLSRATVGIFEHANPDSAERTLASASQSRRRFLVTESIFSMDGDRAPLVALAAVAARRDATLVVDEAHALGALGPSGRGLCADLGVNAEIRIGTLGKAFGSAGGFVAGSRELRALLLNRARTLIYTTAAPASLAAAALAALAVIDSSEGDGLRAQLRHNSAILRTALGTPPFAADHILPLIVGPDRAATELALHLRSAGLVATAIRPPTVPENTARIRITVSAAHTEADLQRLLAALPPAFPRPTTARGRHPTDPAGA